MAGRGVLMKVVSINGTRIRLRGTRRTFFVTLAEIVNFESYLIGDHVKCIFDKTKNGVRLNRPVPVVLIWNNKIHKLA